MAIKTPNIELNETVASPNRKSKSSTNLAKESSLSGGDLVVLHSNQWNHPLLGIIQPWDPDYDLKLGANFSLNQSQHLKYMNTFYNDNVADLTTANILICVDSGDNGDDPNIGGWANQGAVHSGVTFHMAIIGNVMTYIRECQALMSLKLLNSALREAVLRVPASISAQVPPVPSSAATTAVAIPTRVPLFSPSNTSSSSSSSIPPAVAPTEDPTSIRGPSNISPKLWAALTKDFNDSQLRAIRAVCQRDRTDSNPLCPINLLQGPPGTGKFQLPYFSSFYSLIN